jgi:hypothetical protein
LRKYLTEQESTIADLLGLIEIEEGPAKTESAAARRVRSLIQVEERAYLYGQVRPELRGPVDFEEFRRLVLAIEEVELILERAMADYDVKWDEHWEHSVTAPIVKILDEMRDRLVTGLAA